MFYTYIEMKHLWAIALLLMLLSLPGLEAAEQQYGPGRIVSLEKKAHERVLYYLVNTPVTQDDPYYEISLQQGTWLYLAEYTPRHAAGRMEGGGGGSDQAYGQASRLGQIGWGA